MGEELKVYTISIFAPTKTYRIAAPDARTARHAAVYMFMDQDDRPQITSCYELRDIASDNASVNMVVEVADTNDDEW